MSPTNPACDACGADLSAPVYRPLQSRRGVDVVVCSLCGLTQSLFQPYHNDARQTLSADADWGNVRHGKGLRFQALIPVLEQLDWTAINHVLDVGSNRGDFVRWTAQRHPSMKIWAVEPDAKIVDYLDIHDLHFENARFEDVELPDSQFDFIYSCQTLEHASSAADMLRQSWMALRPGAYLLLDVPNLQAIGLHDVVEEFFIDKHVFHFDPTTIQALVESTGFEIVSSSAHGDPFNITILARKIKQSFEYLGRISDPPVMINRSLIEVYQERLHRNRSLLTSLVEGKLRPLAKRQRIAYWGAGRIFDALVKYGGLTASDVHLLVDKHLCKVVSQTHGIAIHRPERLRLHEPQVVVVLARSGESAIAARAYAMGIRHVLKFSELLDQVADAPAIGTP